MPQVPRRYLAAAALTLLWLLACGLAPEPGLMRSYQLLDRSTPTVEDGGGASIVEERTPSVDLTFLDERRHPTQYYLVRWRGVWWSPRHEWIDFHAAADDGVTVRLDGEIAVERNPTIGMTGLPRRVELHAGAHPIEIVHWQHAGERNLVVQWSPAGDPPRPLGGERLFPTDPGAAGYWLAAASTNLPMLVLLAWAAGPTVSFARWSAARCRALTGSELRTRLATVLGPALLGPSQLLLFGPWTVHATNRTEFLESFWRLAPGWAWLLAPITGALAALGIILPARWFSCFVAGLWAAGVLLWIQGNLLVANYGVLDGSGIDLEPHAWRTPYEMGLWVGALCLAVRFAAPVARVAPLASVLLVALQTLAMLVGGQSASATTRNPGWRLPPAEIFELSRTRNIIHVVLDMFPAHVFEEILDSDRRAFDRGWSGFTWFADHLGIHRNTHVSMPAMITGVAYRNDVPFDDYLARRADTSVFDALAEQGWRIRILAAIPFPYSGATGPAGEAAVRYDIPAPYGSHRDYVRAASAQLLDLSLFRHAPHGVKSHVYRDRQWLLTQRLLPERVEEHPVGNAEFLSEFARRATAVHDAPVYTFMHLMTPHPPIVTDADCAYVGGVLEPTMDNYVAQARCSLGLMEGLFDRLRAIGIYDRSAIVVTSDHGAAVGDMGPLSDVSTPAGPLSTIVPYARPLLAVKPAGSRGSLLTSGAPTAITDLPATLLDLAGLPNSLGHGISALTLDPEEPRSRMFSFPKFPLRSHPVPRPYFDLLHWFEVTGEATGAQSWRYRQAVFEPSRLRERNLGPYRRGITESSETGDAGSGGPARVYRTEDYAVFYMPPETRRIAFDVRSLATGRSAGRAELVVRVDGRVAARYEIADDAWRTLDLPVDPRSAEDSPFCIELLVSPVSHDSNGNEPTGVLLRGDI